MVAEQIIAADDDGIRLDRWFKRHYPGFPHALLEKQLRKGDIRLDGKKAKSSDRIQAGQTLKHLPIVIDTPTRVSQEARKEEMAEIKNWVLYKDDNIIVINKPAGLAVQGGSGVRRSLDDMLGGLCFDRAEKPKLTHRLDRDTSGCLVLARHTKAAQHLMKLFSSRNIDKTYWALVNGLPQPLRDTIDLKIAKKAKPKETGFPSGPDGRDYEIMQVDEEGQKAVSEYRVIDQLATKFSLVELKPLTGRTHQLRVHMQAIGCPIVGDHKYGESTTQLDTMGVADQLHLHARRIIVPDANGRAIDVKAPLPQHMRQSFEALGIEINNL